MILKFRAKALINRFIKQKGITMSKTEKTQQEILYSKIQGAIMFLTVNRCKSGKTGISFFSQNTQGGY